MSRIKKTDIATLLKLLDEPNQQAASMIMAELLEQEVGLEKYLAELQESGDPLVRKRVHQLESILFLRKRRREFAKKLHDHAIDIPCGLFEIHLQWYDNDSLEVLEKEWKKLLESARKSSIVDIESIAYFMRKLGFSSPPPNDIQADYYCIGIIMEEFTGADVILCAMAQAIAKHFGIDLQLIQVMENFALIDANKRVLTPKDGWRMHSPLKEDVFKVWDTVTVLKYAVSMLFLSAVSSDSFRYVNTIGTCLGKAMGCKDISFLPYPYNQTPASKSPARNEKKKK